MKVMYKERMLTDKQMIPVLVIFIYVLMHRSKLTCFPCLVICDYS